MTMGPRLGLATALCALAALFSAGSAVAAGGEIHGKVTDHLGEPIAGITVCAHGFERSDCDWNTDAEGKYSIGGLAAGFYRVGFHVEGNPSLDYVQQWYSGEVYAEEADPVQLAEGESKEINAQLQTGGKIHGTVADQETDLPIEGVEVCARLLAFHDGEVGYCDRSGDAGEFTVQNLGTGQYRLEFETEEHVNYVDEQLPEPPGSISLTAGGTIEVEAHLWPGVEIEGTLTESGTGTPIVGFLAPYVVPSICALNPTTQERVKCGWVDSAGQYSIAGLPAGTYAVSFALDVVSEGLDLHPDGYVRRYWKEVPTFGETTLLSGAAGVVFDEIDAVLTQGEEVFPNCEVQSACLSLPGPGETSSGATLSGGVVTPITSPRAQPAVHRPPPRLRCKKGFRRVMRSGHAQCVKVSRRRRHR
jgi:hypothetical protein